METASGRAQQSSGHTRESGPRKNLIRKAVMVSQKRSCIGCSGVVGTRRQQYAQGLGKMGGRCVSGSISDI